MYEFIRIGNTIINLAQVTSVKLDGKDNNGKPVTVVSFAGTASEVWLKGEEREQANIIFVGLATEEQVTA